MYARMVTSQVKPHQLDQMEAVYKDDLLPLIEHQPGFKGIFVMHDPESNKEVSITLWENIVDMEAFNVYVLSLKDAFTPLLATAPDIEIFQLVVPEEPEPVEVIALSESSLGIRIEDPFSQALS